MINLTIDGKSVQAEEGKTILEVAKENGINIPTLCYLKNINEIGSCRMCLVEVEGARGYMTSCVTKASEGMVVKTNTPGIVGARKTNLDLLLSNHKRECLTCIRNKNCELQDLAETFGMVNLEYEGERKEYDIDSESPSIVRDSNKCILCGRCVSVCKNIQRVGAIENTNRGFECRISTTMDKPLDKTNCVMCGQCTVACPVGALYEKDNTKEVWNKIEDENVHVVVQTAPAVRVALGEEFGFPIGTNVVGKMAAALKQIGFDKVFDTNYGADLTIMEEGTEFIKRLNGEGKLPMITSCSPGWINYAELHYPEFLDNLSTCKSPQSMLGAIIKSYYAEKANVDKEKIYSVAVMPCTAKKYEKTREGISEDIDAVITTRELARMIKQANIDFTALDEAEFDNPLGESTGAGVIFGTTSGVMEAALRTVSEIVSGKELEKVDFENIRGNEGIKRATIKVGDKDIKIAIVHGLGNAEKMLEEIKEGDAHYDFIEIMACPGGCINGGGQPIVSSKIRMDTNVRKLRADALYELDKGTKLRKSHENPAIQKLYSEYLGEPGGHKSHELLHTHYHARTY